MTSVRLSRVWVLLASSGLIGGAIVVAACTGDEATTSSLGPDGSTGVDGSTAQPDTSTPPPPPADDGSTPPPDEEIVDGGGLPPEDDDGGLTDLDGGFDAGVACAALTAGAFVKSGCASLTTKLMGGTLTTTTYELASISVLGSTTFCGDGGAYVPYDHRGALEVTATSATTATFEFLDQYRKSGITLTRPSTMRYDVTATGDGGAGLIYAPQACASTPAPASAAYTAGTNKAGKKFIVLRLPWGKGGFANYQYVEP